MQEQLMAAVLVAAPVVGGGLVAWGKLRSDIGRVRKDVSGKVDDKLITAWLSQVDARLLRIENKLDRMNGVR